MQLNHITDLIGIIFPVAMLIISILYLVTNYEKYKKIELDNFNEEITGKNEQTFDASVDIGKNILLEQKYFLRSISSICGIIASLGLLVLMLQLFRYNSPVATETLNKMLVNHGTVYYVNKTLHEIALALCILGGIGIFFVVIIFMRLNKNN